MITAPNDVTALADPEMLAVVAEEIRTVQGVKRTETRMVLKKYNGNGK